MKQYYIESSYSGELYLLDAKTLEDAKSEVQNEWANSGKRKIVCVTFQKVKTKEYVIDTDYK